MMTEAEENRPLLAFVEATKTSFSYRIDTRLADHVFHTYLEKWAYDELWGAFITQYPDNPDRTLFIRSVLAEFGLEVVGPQTVTWNAGDENLPREGFANITGGKSYYALAATADPEKGEWTGEADAVEFVVPEPGRSSATVTIDLLDLQPELLESCITPDENIRFYFYHLFQKAVVDAFIAQFGQEAFENHIYEYGYCSDSPYTDLWRMEPGTEYLIAVLGGDLEGDVMYTDKAFTAPTHEPEVTVRLQPYENELQGYFAYENLELHVGLQNFGDVTHEQATWALLEQEQVDQALAMAGDGATLETCINDGYIYTMPIAPEWFEQIEQTNTFSYLFEGVAPETDYVFLFVTFDAEQNMVLGRGDATTPAAPTTGQTDPEYLAYLGSWRLEGQSTEDWTTPLAYDLTIEALTPNRSFLVRGWSKTDVGQEFPFVMNYDPETKKAYINAPQSLGTRNENGEEVEVVFAGMFVYGFTDALSIYVAPTYKAYEIRLNDNRLSFFPEMFRFEGQDYSFASLGYNGRTEAGYRTFEGDEYNPINFRVTRSPAATAVRRNAPAIRSAGRDCTRPAGFDFPASRTERATTAPADAKLPAAPGDPHRLR